MILLLVRYFNDGGNISTILPLEMPWDLG